MSDLIEMLRKLGEFLEEDNLADPFVPWDAIARIERLEAERDAERALADQLGRRLQAWSDDYVIEHDLDPGDLGGTYRALAAWREARRGVE